MAASQTEELKQQLLAEKERLEALLGRTGKHLYRRDEPYSADFEEQAVETSNNDVVEQLDRDGQRELQQIDRALQRMEQGTYGECIRCGNTIRAERLRAIPHTELCIDCAQ